MHLLVVEDDPRLGRLLLRLFANDRHVVDLAVTGLDAIELLEANPGFDAVILDVGLPSMDGFAVARRVRDAGSRIPILMLTARDGVSDRVTGLDAGADDYLVKPFAYAELAARLRAVCRRVSAEPLDVGQLLHVGPISLDETRRSVTVDGRDIDLTLRQLLDMAWPFGVAVTPNTVDAFVALLRRKLGAAGAARIETIRGIGYRMTEA